MMWYDGEPRQEAMDQITKFYIDSTENIGNMEKFENLTDLFTDRIFIHGTHEAVKVQVQHSPVYLYYYTYKGTFSLTNLMLAIKGKLSPTIEFLYFFGTRWLQYKLFGVEPHHYGTWSI